MRNTYQVGGEGEEDGGREEPGLSACSLHGNLSRSPDSRVRVLSLLLSSAPRLHPPHACTFSGAVIVGRNSGLVAAGSAWPGRVA